MDRYDVVIIGGGSAGCVLAARLSEDPARRVLLVEAGPDPQPLPEIIASAKRQADLMLGSPFVKEYHVPRPDGSTYPLLAGRLMGGGSSVNMMAMNRPMGPDFEAWSSIGGPAWSYESLLPILRGIETDHDFPESSIHGKSGPIHAERAWKPGQKSDPPVEGMVAAAQAMGLPVCEDMNVLNPIGIAASAYNVKGGLRQSTAVAYLGPARTRANLTILAETQATRLEIQGDRVVAVELLRDGRTERVEADRFVLASGVFHSPQLLLLSGVGPAEELARHGIPVKVDLPVGRDYRDHVTLYVTFQGTPEMAVEDYVIPKVRLIYKSDPSLPCADFHIFFRPAIRVTGLDPMMPVSLHLLENRTPGRVSLASTDPTADPLIEPALLKHPDDVGAVLRAMEFITELTAHPALQPFYGSLIQPADGDDREEYIQSSFGVYWHGVATCRFGLDGDPGAVVTPELRVRGLANAWVGDASVLPTVPHANTNVAVVTVAERAARLIAAD